MSRFGSDGPFAHELESHRLIARTPIQHETIIQHFYFLFLPERETIFTLICVQRDGGEDITAVCDSSAKSFRGEETAKWYSVNIPPGWKNVDSNPNRDVFMSSESTILMVSEKPYVGELDAFIDQIHQKLKISVQSRDLFETPAGPMTRLITTIQHPEAGDFPSRQYFLMVPHRESVLVVMCTPELGGTDMDECEKIVSTLTMSAQ